MKKRSAILWCLAALFNLLATQAQQQPAPAQPDLVWHQVSDFGVEGQGWSKADLAAPFDRLPAKAQDVVRGAVWNLSRQSAGLSFRFNTDATEFTLRYSLGLPALALPHMPATGVSGMDLYALHGGQWRWVDCSKPASQEVEFKISGLDKGKRTYLAYLPLYNSVTKLEVGIPRAHVFEPIAPRSEKPIVFYGTSITQGASASRPGMTHPAILGRRLDRPVINLGFSGNGRMEPEVGALLAELDPCLFIIDCLPNMTEDEVKQQAADLVRQLKVARPDAPILLVEDRTYANAWIQASKRARHEGSRSALVAAHDKVLKEGLKGVYLLGGDSLLGEDSEATTDGSHPSDLGFMRQADVFEPAIKKALGIE